MKRNPDELGQGAGGDASEAGNTANTRDEADPGDGGSRYVAVITVPDEGAAEVARDALDGYQIPVRLKRLAPNVYLGAGTPTEIEIRVPVIRIDEARAALVRVQEELARVTRVEADPDGSDDPDEPIAPPELRPRRVAWAIALALVFPVPAIPAGMIYARAPQAIWVTLTSACVSILLARAAGVTVPEVTYWFSLVGLRVVDVILAPMFVRRFNRSLAPPQRPPPLLN